MYQHEIELFCAVLPFWLALLHWVGKQGEKGKEQRLKVWGKSLSLCWDSDSVWGLQGGPVAVGTAGTWREPESSSCALPRTGQEQMEARAVWGSTGRSVVWAVTCGSRALLAAAAGTRELVALKLLIHSNGRWQEK